jgi:hypothetical protein
MAGNSFLLKGWAITISLAGFGLFVSSDGKSAFLLLVAFAISIFWLLDAYFLKRERLLIKLYEKVASSDGKELKSLSLDTSSYKDGLPSLIHTMLSFPTVVIYAAILVMTAILCFGNKTT